VPVGDIVMGGSAEPDGTVMLVLDADGIIEVAGGRGGSRLEAAAVPGVPTAQPSRPKARARVIVVDDALTVRELQRSILERAGYEVRVAVDGIDALEKIDDGVDLMLTDIEMPRMDGLTLTRSVRAKPQWANLPIVMLTTRSSPEDRQAGMEAGADAYIVKSAFNESALIGIVESLLGSRNP
jgi:two-component system, chemotaxis family, sensor kinase CheA